MNQRPSPQLLAHLEARYVEHVEQIVDLEAEVKRLRGVIEDCWGQHKGEELRFVVAVSGLGARPYPPQQLARELTARWSSMFEIGEGYVTVDESSRAALEPQPQAEGGPGASERTRE